MDHDDLVIQYDVAVEFGVLTSEFRAAGDRGDKGTVIAALRQALDDVPEGVERGLHLCYGDYKHRHFTVPQDLSLCVEFATECGMARIDGARAAARRSRSCSRCTRTWRRRSAERQPPPRSRGSSWSHGSATASRAPS